jgi:F0F1-type ATP synthase membrane subunit b/b'
MEATLQALGGILLRAIPTFLLVVALHFYLKLMFFQPLQRVLRQRFEATEGARELAEASLKRASEKAAEYEAALRAARAETYKELEQLRKQSQEERAAGVRQARAQAEAAVAQAKAELGVQMDGLKKQLAVESEALADQIASKILRGRAA